MRPHRFDLQLQIAALDQGTGLELDQVPMWP